jgi:hypothetical protein
VRTRLAVGRVIVYKKGSGWIRQGDPSPRTPLLNRALIAIRLFQHAAYPPPHKHFFDQSTLRLSTVQAHELDVTRRTTLDADVSVSGCTKEVFFLCFISFCLF